MERREVALNVGCCRNHLHLPKCLTVLYYKKTNRILLSGTFFPRQQNIVVYIILVPVKFHDIILQQKLNTHSVLDGIYSLRIPCYFIAIIIVNCVQSIFTTSLICNAMKRRLPNPFIPANLIDTHWKWVVVFFIIILRRSMPSGLCFLTSVTEVCHC